MLKTTITDIARELNTTPATVSRALSDHPRISDKTKKSVHETALKRNKIASSLRSGRTHLIGVIIPSAEINFFGSVVHGIESVANENGYGVLLFQSNEKRDYEEKGLQNFLSARVDGILVSIAKDTTDYSHFNEIKSRHIPLVFFDRTNDDLGVDSVVIDDYKGAFMATEHLLAQGYKRIAHISGPRHLKNFNDSLKGYIAALEKNKITPQPQDHTQATYATKIYKEEALLDWTQEAKSIERTIRAFNPWPGAFTELNNRKLKIFAASIVFSSIPLA